MLALPFTKRSRFPLGGRPGVLRTYMHDDPDDWGWYDALPDQIKRNLDSAAAESGPFEQRGSGLGWEEVIYNPNASGTAVTAAANTILLPDFSIPASYMSVGKTLKYTIMGQQSSAVTTPGTFTHILKWGGVGGAAVATSGAFAPDTVSVATNLTWMIEYWMQTRTVGASGTALGFARVEWSDYNFATLTTLAANLNMRMAPAAAPAPVTIDTTIDKLLSATYTASLTTASCQALFGILEAIN